MVTIVEVVGPAAAGKSTLVPRLAISLQLLGIEVASSADRLPVLSYVLRLPDVLRALAAVIRTYSRTPISAMTRCIVGNPRSFRIYLVWTRAKNLIRRVVAVKTPKQGVCLIENGEAFFNSDTRLHNCRGLGAIPPKTSVLIYLDVTEALMVERLHSRGLSKGPESRALAENRQFRVAYRNAIKRVFEEMSEQLPSLVVDGSLPTENQVATILDFLSQHVEQ